MLSTVAFLTIISLAHSAVLPPVFQKCNRKQPDLKECIIKAAQDGIAKLEHPVQGIKLPNLVPFEVLEAVVGAGKSTVAVVQKFRNIHVYGLPDVKFNRFEFDFDKKILNMNATFPELKLLAEYELDGKVLLLPIQGKGRSTIVLGNVHATALLKYEEKLKKNKTYIRFVSSKLDFDPESLSFNFENLFNGNKELGDNINHVLNDNWKVVFEDVKSGYVEIINQILLNVFNGFFAQVSLEDALD